ncbi:GGT1 [Branchiostoma lanceolatum]|uniref:Glutathione hydrolase n=1 Tax=Branchiostoma lanceolatum TaxID=7740 RepID=A0A8J9YPU2_BRALA|nr:GGT1 [Branchiostoma lanceolatum]
MPNKKYVAVGLAVASVVVVAALAVGLGVGLTRPSRSRQGKAVGDPCQPARPPTGTGGPYRYAAVAADAGECSEIGSDILKGGGSAVDSAIATLLCIGLFNAHSMGIGGGFFMTIYNATTNTADVINARETGPAGASENMFKNASSTTGEIRGYWEAHQRYGKLPWGYLFQPTIQLAEEGFCIGRAMAVAIKDTEDEIKNPKSHMCEVFCDENGNILGENQIMKRPQLAETLRAIAAGNADTFYRGEIAAYLVKDIQYANGIITLQDLRDYRVNVTSALSISLDGPEGTLTVLSPPPPASGAVLSLILHILEGYGFSTSSVQGFDNQVLTYHRMVEAFKFGFAKRTELGDPHFVNVNEAVKNMTSRAYADSLRLKINDSRTYNYTYYGPSYAMPPDGGTSHLSVLAPNGDAVAVTSTINQYFGAKRRSPSTGILLNDEMDCFSSPNKTNAFGVPPTVGTYTIPPPGLPTGVRIVEFGNKENDWPGESVHRKANYIKPGKRPLSSMTPCIILDSNNDVRMVVGASGGTKITTATAYVAMQHLWFGLNDIGAAVEKPRLHHQLRPQHIDVEELRPFTPEAVLQGLRLKGHMIKEADSAIVQAIAKVNSAITAHCDSIKGGFPSGF